MTMSLKQWSASAARSGGLDRNLIWRLVALVITVHGFESSSALETVGL